MNIDIKPYACIISSLVLLFMINMTVFVALPWGAVAETSGDYEFRLINGGTEVEISGYHGSMEYAAIPEEVESRPVTSIGDSAFVNSSLTSVAIPRTVMNIGDRAFSHCPSLTAIHVNSGNDHLVSVKGVLYNETMTTLIRCPEGSEGNHIIPNSVMHIGDGAFASCRYQRSITIPGNVIHIGDGAFRECDALVNMTFLGNAPTCGEGWWDGGNEDRTVYYYNDTIGFTDPWNGVQTVVLFRPTVPGSPSNLTAIPGDGRVRFSWNGPVNDGGAAIGGYYFFIVQG